MKGEVPGEYIIDAVDRAILRYGYEKTTMNDIAQEAGISRASLYRFFPDRESLIRAQIGRWTGALEARLGTVLGRNVSWAEKIDEIIHLSITHLTDGALRVPGIRDSFFSDIGGTCAWLQPAYAVSRGAIEKALRGGVGASEFKAAPVKKTAAALVTLIQLLQMRAIADHGEEKKEEAGCRRNLMTLVIDGLKT